MIPREYYKRVILGKSKKSSKPTEDIQQGGYVRRGSEYQQASDWHHDVYFEFFFFFLPPPHTILYCDLIYLF